MKAAILEEPGKLVVRDDVEIEDPRAGIDELGNHFEIRSHAVASACTLVRNASRTLRYRGNANRKESWPCSDSITAEATFFRAAMSASTISLKRR